MWIVSDPRPEHVSAITWLNESSSASFYLLKLEAIRIGDSAPAPLLTLIVGPGESTKAVGKAKQKFAERYGVRRDFWQGLLAHAKTKTKLFVSISPSKYHWIGTGAGRSGLSFIFVVVEHEGSSELYIDRGKEADTENKAIFDSLLAKKPEIEAAFGGALDWQRLDAKRACRIRYTVPGGGYRDLDQYPVTQAAMVDAMIRLERAFKPFIQKLSVESA